MTNLARARAATMALVLMGGTAGTIVGGPSSAWAQGGMPTPEVVVANPLAKRIVQWDEYTGRFEAFQRVEVRPRVSGYIAQIHFQDGAMVHKGDKLFTIDPRPYEIAVQSARADVMRAAAEVTRAGADYQRAVQLARSATTTVRDLDTRRAQSETAQAQQISAAAALRNAALNLEWTEVTAPIDGRISDRKVDVGNLVSGTGEATLLTTIVARDPIYFVFEGSENDYLHYLRMSRSGQRPSSRDAPNPVQVKLADETTWAHNGHMDFLDNAVSTRTGTIRGRAIFDNHDGFFTPGVFGRLRLFGGYADVLLVPDAAVVADQAQKIVLVVGEDGTVAPRPVTLGVLAYGQRAILSGLSPKDRVIVGGLANPFVRPGAKVNARDGKITAEPDPAEAAAVPPDAKAAQVPGVMPAAGAQ